MKCIKNILVPLVTTLAVISPVSVLAADSGEVTLSTNVEKTSSLTKLDSATTTPDDVKLNVVETSLDTKIPSSDALITNQVIQKNANNVRPEVIIAPSPKQLARMVWAAGSTEIIKNSYGHILTDKLLQNSLQDRPPSMSFKDSRTQDLVKKSSEYKNLIDSWVAEAKKNKVTSFTKNSSLAFASGELFTAIHRANIYTYGKVDKYGKWTLTTTISDKFNFELNMMGYYGKKGVEWAAANAAVISQGIGAIVPFDVVLVVEDTR
jgi:hypothetical protein